MERKLPSVSYFIHSEISSKAETAKGDDHCVERFYPWVAVDILFWMETNDLVYKQNWMSSDFELLHVPGVAY